MRINNAKQLNPVTPIVFSNGLDFYTKLANEYIQHRGKGYFILAPSGAGKTFFISHQDARHWIDGDYLWVATGADYSDDSWGINIEDIEEINNRSDIITHQATKLGFWLMGSSNSFLKPDAIVLPPWETHTAYIEQRELKHYDGGAKTKDLGGVKDHRKWILRWKHKGVPCFESIQEAASFLEKEYKRQCATEKSA